MSNILTLPYQQSDPTGEDVAFEIDAVTGATAILGQSNGASFDQGGPSYAPIGVQGQSDVGIGVKGGSGVQTDDYVIGSPAIGVLGESAAGVGVLGVSYGQDASGNGVQGVSSSPQASGVWGNNTGAGVGVSGSSTGLTATSNGVQGSSASPNASGVWGNNTGGGVGVAGSSATGIGVSATGTPAGYFQGDVKVTGDVILVNSSSGDVSEDFDVEDGSTDMEPGTVLVIGSTGKLCVSSDPYDTRVAGVVSGAGGLKPAIVLQRIESCQARSPIALIGKAFCKVDASFARIAAGDLLTTSSTPGHAMKVLDPRRATGAILGKALHGFMDGQGLIPILISTR
jgi:hypothetical protein